MQSCNVLLLNVPSIISRMRNCIEIYFNEIQIKLYVELFLYIKNFCESGAVNWGF